MDSHGLITITTLSFYILLLLCLVSITNLAFASNSCNFPAIFNFGDSNSDTGGLSAAYYRIPPPNGDTFFHMPAGRNSDGRLIIDFMAESLKLPYLHAYLDSVESNFSHGVNFATSAAPIRPQERGLSEGGYSPFSLDVQYGQFSQFKSRSQTVSKKGVFKNLLPKNDYFGKGLYTFDIGQNDLGGAFLGNMSIQEVNASIPDIINKFILNVKSIYIEGGGRSFWIHNTGPIGCLAYILATFPITEDQLDEAGCAISYNDVARYFNQRLKDSVVELRKELPLAAFTYVDIYSAKYSLISQAKKYGFEQPLVACCGYGGKYNYNGFYCGYTIQVNGSQVFVGSCERPSVRVIWDGVHYNEAANKWVFNQIVNGGFSDPPIPLRLACHKHAI